MEFGRVDAVWSRQCGDRLPGERLDPEPTDRSLGREFTEHDPEWVSAVEFVVAIGGQDESRNRVELR